MSRYKAKLHRKTTPCTAVDYIPNGCSLLATPSLELNARPLPRAPPTPAARCPLTRHGEERHRRSGHRRHVRQCPPSLSPPLHRERARHFILTWAQRQPSPVRYHHRLPYGGLSRRPRVARLRATAHTDPPDTSLREVDDHEHPPRQQRCQGRHEQRQRARVRSHHGGAPILRQPVACQ